ncbi:hypothetical protein N8387_06015 [Polaribacter sp.]|jgi:hypothetical protein|nr:hypothetical protein [Polaribacter sp.]
MKKSIHLVSFDIPYPPNYGGIIDIFFKIKELHKLGIQIYLHTYLFNDKTREPELEKYCEKIFYYKRKNAFLSLFSKLPFRVQSRSCNKLIENLKNLQFPIIFEGLHTAYPLTKHPFKNTYVRAHNIEHDYFLGLSKSEKNIFKKVFFLLESIKLKRFENILEKATGIFSISPFEQAYFTKKYGAKTFYIPVFHAAKNVTQTFEKGNFILYHGDLRIADNVRAALFLIDIYKNTQYQFVVASSYKNKSVLKQINMYYNIKFKDIPTQESLDQLFKKAQINTLFTFQKTGIKLKLLNTLHQGKHIISNTQMIEDTGLEALCELANTKKEILEKTSKLLEQTFSETQVIARKEKLLDFNTQENAKKIVAIIFKQ